MACRAGHTCQVPGVFWGFLPTACVGPDLHEHIARLTEAGAEQIIPEDPALFAEIPAGDALVLRSLSDIGLAGFDLWPVVLALYDRGVALICADLGFCSAMPDGDLVMGSIRQAVEGQRRFLLGQAAQGPTPPSPASAPTRRGRRRSRVAPVHYPIPEETVITSAPPDQEPPESRVSPKRRSRSRPSQ
jgi:hypothetical protein